MPPARSDTRLLLGAGAAAVLGGVLVAVVLLLATSRADQPKTYRPFAAGPEDQLRKELRDGGPFYYPHAFGGEGRLPFALQGGQGVALMTPTPRDEAGPGPWRRGGQHHLDCRGDPLRSEQLGRYETTIRNDRDVGRVVVVDLRGELPPTAPAG